MPPENKEDLEFEKEFNLEPEDAAALLRDMADSIENEDKFIMEGDDWQLFQPIEGNVPLRITKDLTGMEVGFKIISKAEE